MSFTVTQKVLFKHCDPAGMVFYPRYFVMINDCVEAFFDAALGYPFETLHISGGVPTARIAAVFTAPSRHGDILDIELRCERLGSSSLDLNITARCANEIRFKADSTLVYVDKNGRPERWPSALRQALEYYIKGDA